jgi:hypothetical protein
MLGLVAGALYAVVAAVTALPFELKWAAYLFGLAVLVGCVVTVARVRPRPGLALFYDPADPRCHPARDGATQYHRVGIINRTRQRQERCSVALEALAPPDLEKRIGAIRRFSLAGTTQTEFDVPPTTTDQPTAFVDAVAITITQRPVNWLCIQNGIDLDGVDAVTLTLRLEANLPAPTLAVQLEKKGSKALGIMSPDLRPVLTSVPPGE